jgi:hypothetical protein
MGFEATADTVLFSTAAGVILFEINTVVDGKNDSFKLIRKFFWF